MDKIIQQIEKLERDSRNVKTAHNLAFQKKKLIHMILGISTITINIIILSPLIELITPKYTVISVRILATISAALAASQTFFNYQKQMELHSNAVDTYTRIYRECGVLLARHKDNLIGKDDCLTRFDDLRQNYYKANNDYKASIPTNKQYNEANKLIKERSNN